jgi:hypothetical protein
MATIVLFSCGAATIAIKPSHRVHRAYIKGLPEDVACRGLSAAAIVTIIPKHILPRYEPWPPVTG